MTREENASTTVPGHELLFTTTNNKIAKQSISLSFSKTLHKSPRELKKWGIILSVFSNRVIESYAFSQRKCESHCGESNILKSNDFRWFAEVFFVWLSRSQNQFRD